jgi:hypothetical protein
MANRARQEEAVHARDVPLAAIKDEDVSLQEHQSKNMSENAVLRQQ